MPTAFVEHHDPVGGRGPALTDFVIRIDENELEALGSAGYERADLNDISHAVIWGLILLRTLRRQGTYADDADDDRAHLRGIIRALERTLLPRLTGIRDAAVRAHAQLGGSHGDLAAAMDVPRSTAQSRGKALAGREPSEEERWATGPGPSALPAAPADQEGHDDPVARTGVVPWDTVTSPKGERAWTAGQLRAALADLPDDAPVIVHVANESDPEAVDDQIITSAGYGNVAWGDGYGMERDPIFALECHWHTKDQLLIRPKRPRRT